MRDDLGMVYVRPEGFCDMFTARLSARHLRGTDRQGPYVNTGLFLRDDPKVCIDLDMSWFDFSCLESVDSLLRQMPDTRKSYTVQNLPGEFVVQMIDDRHAYIVSPDVQENHKVIVKTLEAALSEVYGRIASKDVVQAIEDCCAAREIVEVSIAAGQRKAFDISDRLAEAEYEVLNIAVSSVREDYNIAASILSEVSADDILDTDALERAGCFLDQSRKTQDIIVRAYAQCIDGSAKFMSERMRDSAQLDRMQDKVRKLIGYKDELRKYSEHMKVAGRAPGFRKKRILRSVVDASEKVFSSIFSSPEKCIPAEVSMLSAAKRLHDSALEALGLSPAEIAAYNMFQNPLGNIIP